MADRTARDEWLSEPLTPSEALDEVRARRVRQIQTLNLTREEVRLYRNLLIEFATGCGSITSLDELRRMIEHSEQSAAESASLRAREEGNVR